MGFTAQSQPTGTIATLDQFAIESISEHPAIPIAAYAKALGGTKATFAAGNCVGTGAVS